MEKRQDEGGKDSKAEVVGHGKTGRKRKDVGSRKKKGGRDVE